MPRNPSPILKPRRVERGTVPRCCTLHGRVAHATKAPSQRVWTRDLCRVLSRLDSRCGHQTRPPGMRRSIELPGDCCTTSSHSLIFSTSATSGHFLSVRESQSRRLSRFPVKRAVVHRYRGRVSFRLGRYTPKWSWSGGASSPQGRHPVVLAGGPWLEPEARARGAGRLRFARPLRVDRLPWFQGSIRYRPCDFPPFRQTPG